jgi:hypothetical protein
MLLRTHSALKNPFNILKKYMTHSANMPQVPRVHAFLRNRGTRVLSGGFRFPSSPPYACTQVPRQITENKKQTQKAKNNSLSTYSPITLTPVTKNFLPEKAGDESIKAQ